MYTQGLDQKSAENETSIADEGIAAASFQARIDAEEKNRSEGLDA